MLELLFGYWEDRKIATPSNKHKHFGISDMIFRSELGRGCEYSRVIVIEMHINYYAISKL